MEPGGLKKKAGGEILHPQNFLRVKIMLLSKNMPTQTLDSSFRKVLMGFISINTNIYIFEV